MDGSNEVAGSRQNPQRASTASPGRRHRGFWGHPFTRGSGEFRAAMGRGAFLDPEMDWDFFLPAAASRIDPIKHLRPQKYGLVLPRGVRAGRWLLAGTATRLPEETRLQKGQLPRRRH